MVVSSCSGGIGFCYYMKSVFVLVFLVGVFRVVVIVWFKLYGDFYFGVRGWRGWMGWVWM